MPCNGTEDTMQPSHLLAAPLSPSTRSLGTLNASAQRPGDTPGRALVTHRNEDIPPPCPSSVTPWAPYRCTSSPGSSCPVFGCTSRNIASRNRSCDGSAGARCRVSGTQRFSLLLPLRYQAVTSSAMSFRRKTRYLLTLRRRTFA